MISFTLTIFILTSGVLGAPTRYDEPNSIQLTEEFRSFVKERLNHVIALTPKAPPSFLLISVSVATSACKNHNTVQKISIEPAQTTWKEEICGTRNMQEWCYEFPERTVTLMTLNKETNTSTMAEFGCDALHEIDNKIETGWTQLIIPCASIAFIVAVIYNFRKLCKEQASRRKLTQVMQKVVESSMDSVNLDSSCREKCRKELARFDDDSDPSLGTLFTI
uniref:Ig-like domain-containing protein n=1 Tax=Caenorhabditis tropicalis TaxID=1561998 RepID=A0A1I7TT99_9PELO